MAVQEVFFVLRPDSLGNWFVQDDADHASVGVDKVTGVLYTPNSLRVYFTPVYAKAGVVSVTTDDDFAGAISANANLGTQCVEIKLRAHPNILGIDPPIDPKRIWEYLTPAKGYTKGVGNLWVHIRMHAA